MMGVDPAFSYALITLEEALKYKIEREKKARKQAEMILEQKSREHFFLNADLQKSQERFTLATLGSNDGIWDWNLSEGTIFFSRRWKSILRLDDHDIDPTLDAWMYRIHPKDVLNVRTILVNYLKKPEAHFEVEYRMRHKNGSYLWVSTRGIGVVDEGDRVVRMAGSQSDITLRKRIQDQLYKEAISDRLTGLYNRTVFMERLDQALNGRQASDVGLLFIDLDSFKLINDSLGHNLGDRLLVIAAKRLSSCLRESDTIARWGGDEFILLIDGDCTEELSTSIAERMLESLRRPVKLGGQEIFPEASVGIALSKGLSIEAETLVRYADLAMYEVKNTKKGAYMIFNQEMNNRVNRRLMFEMDLKRALQKKEIFLQYQPIMDLKTLRPVGMEALMRWQHPKLGLIPPFEFIPIAEESFLINQLGTFALEEGCRDLKKIHECHDNDQFFVHINVSARQLLDVDFLETVKKIVEKNNVWPENLNIELTESMLISSGDQAQYAMEGLRAMGIGLSIDDFGTGYSSLSILHTYPFTVIKIDKSFIHDLETNLKTKKMVQMISQLANSLDIKTVVEGVETIEELRAVQACSCDFVQGYYLAKPMVFNELKKYLAGFRRS